MLGKNLPLSYFVQDPQICNSYFLGIPALGKTGSIHVDTIALAAASMALILMTAAAITPTLTSEKAGGTGQTILETYYEFIANLTREQIGSGYKKFMPLVGGIFIFVLVNNFLGVGPWKALEFIPGWPQLHHEPFEVAAATTDFNVTAALATITFLTYIGSGLAVHGHKYLMLYLNPLNFIGWIIEWLDFVIRPSTLAIRLMCVITADEIIRSVALNLVPVVLPTGVMAFELFIGVIQAFVFALLTSIYIGLTVSHH